MDAFEDANVDGCLPQETSPKRFKPVESMPVRVILLLAGVALMALGIDVIISAGMGNSPISSCPYVVSLAISGISFGTIMLVWQVLLIVGQIVILRKDFKLYDLLQIPISVLFGICIDVFGAETALIAPSSYALSWAVIFVGICILALGIACTVVSNTVMNCGEAFVKAIVDKTGFDFGHTKVAFDLTLAVSAAIISFAVFGSLMGVREGTIVSAATTGFVVNFYLFVYGKLSARRPEAGCA